MKLNHFRGQQVAAFCHHHRIIGIGTKAFLAMKSLKIHRVKIFPMRCTSTLRLEHIHQCAFHISLIELKICDEIFIYKNDSSLFFIVFPDHF